MDSGELVVASEALIRIFVVLLYTPICLVVYFQLFPRLSTTSRRLAFGMLAAQALVIVLALEIRPKSNFEHWLWNLDQEWNIPSTLASTQLALVAGVSLLTAWLARAVPVWQRLYLVGIGLVFLFLAWDEYFLFHEHGFRIGRNIMLRSAWCGGGYNGRLRWFAFASTYKDLALDADFRSGNGRLWRHGFRNLHSGKYVEIGVSYALTVACGLMSLKNPSNFSASG